MAYGFGPTIRQWPLETGHQLYGYLKRKPDGKLGLMPIGEQTIRWMTGQPDFDLYQCSYEEFVQWLWSINAKERVMQYGLIGIVK